jgi:hypothetical protein
MPSRKLPNKPNPYAALAMMQKGRVRGRGRRSPIVVWMAENRIVLEQGFAKSAPDWSSFAAYLGDHGLTDGDGKRPTAEATRQAWYRTKSMAAVARASAQPAPVLPPSIEDSPPPPPPLSDCFGGPATLRTDAPPAPVLVEDAPASSRPRFGMATLRNHTPPAPLPPPSQMPTVPQQDPDAVIEAFLNRGRPTGLRKPEPKDE